MAIAIEAMSSYKLSHLLSHSFSSTPTDFLKAINFKKFLATLVRTYVRTYGSTSVGKKDKKKAFHFQKYFIFETKGTTTYARVHDTYIPGPRIFYSPSKKLALTVRFRRPGRLFQIYDISG